MCDLLAPFLAYKLHVDLSVASPSARSDNIWGDKCTSSHELDRSSEQLPSSSLDSVVLLVSLSLVSVELKAPTLDGET